MSTTEIRCGLQADYARRVLAESRPSLDERLALLALPTVPEDDAEREALQLAVGLAIGAVCSALCSLHRTAPDVRNHPVNIIQALAEHRERIKRLSLIDAELRVIQDHLSAEG